MEEMRYVFAGNRAYVLEKMRELKLNILKIWAVKNSYLQCYLDREKIKYSLINNKEQFIREIEQCEFDFFISNGLPIILPITQLRNKNIEKRYVNIHPSLLPELRGKSPVSGALLYHRNSGATCHMMEDGIDTGAIISQVRIENTEDLDAGLLYQLAFMAEVDAFELAYRREFVPYCEQKNNGTEIYYSFQEADLRIDLEKDSIETILAKVRAFSTKTKGAYFVYKDSFFKCLEAQIIQNSFFVDKMSGKQNNSIVMAYEDKMIYKKDDKYINFRIESFDKRI